MRVWPLAAGRYGWLRGLAEEASRRRIYREREKTPLRTIFNSHTGQFEDIPLSEFQQLLMRGEIQETVSRRPDRPPRFVYRLV
ncbi:MAG: hypothetical protein U0893_13945 [Chloroflexota bacterium]